MLATQTPQAAIDAGLPTPADSDIVVMIFRARMGTPLPFPESTKANGESYYSGTEWEFENVIHASRRHGCRNVLLYRCTEKVLRDDEAPGPRSECARDEEYRRRKFVATNTWALLRGFHPLVPPQFAANHM
jgi:hypothetical protein